VARLQQIKSLRQLGFAHDEVRACLEDADFSPLSLIEAQIERLREQIEMQRRLCDRLESIAACLRAAESVSVEDLLLAIEGMNMSEKYYAPEQLEQLKARAAQVGEERIRKAETEDWPNLIAAVRAEMDKGSDPASVPVQALVQRWTALVHAFTAGDPGIEKSLRTMYQQEQTIHGMDVAAMRPMMEYIDKAIAAAKKTE
jgi:DNA-binding transcriptional MerR regulator